jgi:serine protease AprX
VTGASVTKEDGTKAPFWQVGYGRIDLAAAVDLVRSKTALNKLASTQASKDAQVLALTDAKVPTSDFWSWDAPRASVLGTDSRTFTTSVPSTRTGLKVTISHPSLAVVGLNGMEYSVTVSDAAGKVLGTTTESFLGAGTASLQVDLKAAKATAGTFKFAVSGDTAASDPDTLDSESALGRVVVLQVVQLQPR